MIKILLFILSLTFFTFADQKLKNDHYVIKSDKLILNGETLEVDEKINDEEIEFDEVITLEPGQTEVVLEYEYGKWPTINVEFD